MIKTILTNWKTSGAALLSAILGLLNYLFPEKFTPELNTSLLGILVLALGLLSKDANVTGGTTINVPNDASVVKESTKEDSK